MAFQTTGNVYNDLDAIRRLHPRNWSGARDAIIQSYGLREVEEDEGRKNWYRTNRDGELEGLRLGDSEGAGQDDELLQFLNGGGQWGATTGNGGGVIPGNESQVWSSYRLDENSVPDPAGGFTTSYNTLLANAQNAQADNFGGGLGGIIGRAVERYAENPAISIPLTVMGLQGLAGAAGSAGVGAENAVAGGLEYSGIVDAFEWGSAASGAAVSAESAVAGGLEYAGVPSAVGGAEGGALATGAGTASAAELMGPSAVELGVPGATGYTAPYAAEAAGAAVAPATVQAAVAASGAGTAAGGAGLDQFTNFVPTPEYGALNFTPPASGIYGAEPSILSRALDWAKNNQMLASAGVTVGGGIINRALAPTPKEQADAAFQAKLQAENQAAEARRARNRFNLNLNRLKPTGTVLRRPGIISGSMPRPT